MIVCVCQNFHISHPGWLTVLLSVKHSYRTTTKLQCLLIRWISYNWMQYHHNSKKNLRKVQFWVTEYRRRLVVRKWQHLCCISTLQCGNCLYIRKCIVVSKIEIHRLLTKAHKVYNFELTITFFTFVMLPTASFFRTIPRTTEELCRLPPTSFATLTLSTFSGQTWIQAWKAIINRWNRTTLSDI